MPGPDIDLSGEMKRSGLSQLGSNPSMAQMMHPRLISKEQARTVVNAGGLVGVWRHLADTPLDYAKNVRALVDVIGVEHVCIGTDTKLTPASPCPKAWQGETAGFYYVVVDAMLRTGFTPGRDRKDRRRELPPRL